MIGAPSLCDASRAAAVAICANAHDQDDARLLLDITGLLDGDPLAAAPLRPSPRTCPGCGLTKALQKDLCKACQRRWVGTGRPDGEIPDPAPLSRNVYLGRRADGSPGRCETS